MDTGRAHLAFYSKYYVKLRNSAKNSLPRKGPQVGRIGTIEEAMLDSGFGEYLKSIRPVDPLLSHYRSDELLWKVIPWVVGIALAVLVFLGIDSTLVEFTILGVVAIMLWVESRLDRGFFKKYLERIHLMDVQWLCLRCNQQWIETKTRPMK
ncbi:MAG: hypothetical protein SF097_09220 [Acidobacteriota bacterium]|nr:hypothetical protein [Acidobacteriota bacterium]